jgi:hypothetical protein
VSLSETDERYEVVVKHYLRGVLHMGSFKTLDQARAFLVQHWARLSAIAHTECGAAICDKHDSRKHILTLGAAYLVDGEPHSDNYMNTPRV